MKLDVFRILIVGSSELVKLATEPVGVRFVHTDASENRVLLTGVSRRSRVVQIQQLHKKSSRVNFRPTDRNAALSTAVLVYHRTPVAGWAKRFLFDSGQLDRPMSSLSGGEQARVLIARLMLQPAILEVANRREEPLSSSRCPTQGMDISWETRHEATPKLTAVLFLCSAMSIACTFLTIPDGPLFGSTSSWDRPIEIAAKSSPAIFLCACGLLFFRARLGQLLGLVAGFAALSWLVRTECSLDPWNTWIFLNYRDQRGVEGGGIRAFVTLRVLSGAFVGTTVACCLLRLLPAKWELRKSSLSRRTWPAVAAGFVGLAAWFVHSVTPYSVPGYDHGTRAEFRILHVQKCGLRFQEFGASAYRDVRVYVWTDERRLFQYGFNWRVARGGMPYQRLLSFAESPGLWKLHTPPAT